MLHKHISVNQGRIRPLQTVRNKDLRNLTSKQQEIEFSTYLCSKTKIYAKLHNK